MLRPLSIFLLALAGMAAVAVPSGRASAAQLLVVNVTGDGSQVRNLATYDTATPIDMRVIAPAARAAAVLAVDPLGGNQRFALARGADGTWTGPVTLATAGTWTLAIATVGPQGHAATTHAFVVRAERVALQASPEMLIALACISVFGGLGLIGAGRRAAARSESGSPEAATA